MTLLSNLQNKLCFFPRAGYIWLKRIAQNW